MSGHYEEERQDKFFLFVALLEPLGLEILRNFRITCWTLRVLDNAADDHPQAARRFAPHNE